jgi:hypothetical protein
MYVPRNYFLEKKSVSVYLINFREREITFWKNRFEDAHFLGVVMFANEIS